MMIQSCYAEHKPPDPQFDVSETRFLDHLRQRAADDFPDLAGQAYEVTLVSEMRRANSALFEFKVQGTDRVKSLIYKVPFSLKTMDEDPVDRKERPRLFPPIKPVDNGQREFRALQSIERHFAHLDNRSFGTIRVLELLENPYVVMMEKCADPELKTLLKQSTRFHVTNNARALNDVFGRCGQWLKHFHDMPHLEHTQSRHAKRSSFVEATQQFTDELIRLLGRRSFFEQTRDTLIRVCRRVLPDDLPRAVVHGDFAPRNILVGRDARVTVFDTQRRWYAPLYEDLAYLLMTTKTPGPQVKSYGAIYSKAQHELWEDAFLRGYFGDPTPHRQAVRLYECLLTLEWWAVIVERHRNRPWARRTVTSGANLLGTRYLFSYMTRLLRDLES